MFDIGADLQRAYSDGYKCGRLEALAELKRYISEMADYNDKADRKTENNSEKPNNCETCRFELYCPEMCEGCCEWDSHYEPKDEPQRDCFLCKWLGDVDVCGRCRNRNLFAEADTGPTISKMEQVEDEPQTCDNCKLKGSTKWCNNQVVCRAYKPMDEPQTEPLHTCSVNGRPYSECSSCEHFKCTADEPQTDCPWK